jgi:hypothetical protein
MARLPKSPRKRLKIGIWVPACVVLLMAAAVTGCESADPLAPPGSQMTISANPEAIPPGGAVSVITIILSNDNGDPVHDNTVINITTTLGTIESRVETKSGIAIAHLESEDILGTATVTARSGNSDVSATTTVEIVNDAFNQTPEANAGPDQNVDPDETVVLDGSGSTDADGYIVDWFWDFGDGTTGRGEVVTKVYSAEGVYLVVLKVTDDLGATDEDTAVITVTSGPTT